MSVGRYHNILRKGCTFSPWLGVKGDGGGSFLGMYALNIDSRYYVAMATESANTLSKIIITVVCTFLLETVPLEMNVTLALGYGNYNACSCT